MNPAARHAPRIPFVSLALLTLSASAAADVLIVDPTSSTYNEISVAVAAASDGDLILVRPGTYTSDVEITHRGLSIVADGTGPVDLEGELVIRSSPAGTLNVISGLHLEAGFLVEDCAGEVAMQQCVVPKPTALVGPPPNVNFWNYGTCGIGESEQRIVRSARVTVTECSFAGADGDRDAFDGYPGHHGLLVESSSVSLYDCMLAGGDGSDEGGAHPPTYAGAGGDGLRVTGMGSVVYYDRLDATGGLGGHANWAPSSGCEGAATRTDPANTATPDTHPTLALTAPVLLRGSNPGEIRIQGTPGRLIALLSSPNTGWRPLGSGTGNLHVGNPLRISVLGTMPGTGVLVHTVVGNDPQTANDFLGIQYQILSLGTGPRFLSEPRRLHLIDASL